MDQKIIDTLHETAEEFGAIAKKVNEASKLRKTHSEEAMKFINLCLEIGDELGKDMETVAKANADLRNQDTIVQNTCVVLEASLTKQEELIASLQEGNNIDKDLAEKLLAKIEEFRTSLGKATENIASIIAKDNILVLLDNILLSKKKQQHGFTLELKEQTNTALDDAEKAIQGSSSNLERGLSMVEKFKGVEKLVSSNDRAALDELKDEANQGWNIAIKVNESSNSQLDFAEQVNNFTQKLHNYAENIQELVIEKHQVFEQNLQTITVLTVLISLKFMKYLEIEELMEQVEDVPQVWNTINDLRTYVATACNDIRMLAALHYDMTDSSHLNNEIEDKTVKSTKKEIEYFHEISKEVGMMTEATRYPMEGSHKNIGNGKKLEETIDEVIKSL